MGEQKTFSEVNTFTDAFLNGWESYRELMETWEKVGNKKWLEDISFEPIEISFGEDP